MENSCNFHQVAYNVMIIFISSTTASTEPKNTYLTLRNILPSEQDIIRDYGHIQPNLKSISTTISPYLFLILRPNVLHKQNMIIIHQIALFYHLIISSSHHQMIQIDHDQMILHHYLMNLEWEWFNQNNQNNQTKGLKNNPMGTHIHQKVMALCFK